MSIGKQIRSIRTKKGYTQKQLAELTGIAEITIRKYEADAFIPKIEQIEKLANALNVSVYELSGKPQFENAPISLVKQVDFFDSASSLFGKEAAEFFNDYLSLNANGRERASEYLSDLLSIQKYKK